MRQWQFLLGKIRLQITSADCVGLLNALSNAGIYLIDVQYQGELTVLLTIPIHQHGELMKITEKQGASVKQIKKVGIYYTGKAILKRPVLLGLFALLFFLSCYIPSRVFFVSVEGNKDIPTKLILEAAGECGIDFGASRRSVRSEKMKNALLQKIPELQWAGINTTGCTAVISVREKTTQNTQKTETNRVSSIVASRDGIIQNCTVYQGNPLCMVGQAVKAGQTLVSGYLDCGIVVKATQANAEIRALTFRELEVLAPSATAYRGNSLSKKTNYSLLIGKKLIKFYKDSGNVGATCGKIYSQEYVRLPGGFQLPVAIIKETVSYYTQSNKVPTAGDNSWLADFADSYLQGTMIAGEILSGQTEVNAIDDGSYLYGKYACMEMIGQVKYEQTLLKDESND